MKEILLPTPEEIEILIAYRACMPRVFAHSKLEWGNATEGWFIHDPLS
jgi:hypothetical protein